MNILHVAAVDPGPETHGLCLATWGDGPRPRFLFFNDICTEALKREIIEWRCDVVSCGFVCVAVEHIECFGMAVGRAVFETAYNIGALREWVASEFYYTSSTPKTAWIPIYRSEEKMELCRNRSAKSSNIRQALIDIYGEPGTKKIQGVTYGCSGHAWSALAIAHTAQAKLERQAK